MEGNNYIHQLRDCIGVMTTIMQHCHDDDNLFFPDKILLIQQFRVYENTNRYIDYAQSVVAEDADGLLADVKELCNAIEVFLKAYHEAESTIAFRGFTRFFEDECRCVKRDYDKIDAEITRGNNQFMWAWDEPEVRKEKMDESDPEYAAVCAECEEKKQLYIKRLEVSNAVRLAMDLLRENSRYFEGFELSHLQMFATELMTISRCIKADIVELKGKGVL